MRGSISGLTRQHLSLGGTTQPSRSTVLQVATPRSVAGTGASYYPTPAFQNHVEQAGEFPSLRRQCRLCITIFCLLLI